MITWETIVKIINAGEIYKFSRLHADAEKPLDRWLDVVAVAAWNSFWDVRETFRSADYARGFVIFNVAGNKFRLITSIDYSMRHVYVLGLMTHAEYSRWQA
jgi:mRNA interferase HigB